MRSTNGWRRQVFVYVFALFCVFELLGWFKQGPSFIRDQIENLQALVSNVLPVVAPDQVKAVPLLETRNERDVCTNNDVFQTMSTRWLSPASLNSWGSLVFHNSSPEPLFLSLTDRKSGVLIETVLLLAGESITEPVLSLDASLKIARGNQWCNRKIGWRDGTVTLVKGWSGPNTTKSVTMLDISLASESNQLSVVISSVPTSVEDSALAKSSHRLGKPRFVPGQSQKEYGPSEVTKRQEIATSQTALGNSEQLVTNVRLQDWRDVPTRDIRMVSNGNVHYVGGKVEEEDVQFVVSLLGFSGIGEDLAKTVGAYGCRRGNWLVMGRYLSTCQQFVSRLQFGSVELNNVMIAVLPGSQQAVLGRDLIGNASIFEGIDGYYLHVGR